ncbi:MAG TPA: menaquinone biosynthesis protein [Saprospiraceae bacterium]|nr:menaquinone biosynthesis protein [Saprospiraceae bacterium]
MKYSIALVEYLNTMPFSEGIRRTGLDSKLEIHRVIPARCAQLYAEGRVDISLCPVGALPDLPAHEIRGRYCIGADGAVGTVVLLSKVPLDDIASVRLDDHSRTSNLLLQILADRLWKKEWTYYQAQDVVLPESCLMIGDKVFKHKDHYPYSYDLSAAWKELTGLPMVFAVWITRPGIPDELVRDLDLAFESGFEFVKSTQSGLAGWQRDYLVHNISYPLDEAKRKGMDLYLTWAAALEAAPVNI